MSLPIAKVNGSRAFRHSLESKTPKSRTSADFRFGISTPTARFPGIGASTRIDSAAKFSAILSLRFSILLSFTPLCGTKVYCVTRGPIFAASISTSILNSLSVSLIVRAFCSTSPASAGFCECSSKSKPGACHFESSKIGAWFSAFFESSAELSLAFEIRIKPFFSFCSAFSRDFLSKTATPAFSLISGFSVLFKSSAFFESIASLAFSKTLAFLDSLAKSLVLSISLIFLITTIGETRKIESNVIEIKSK